MKGNLVKISGGLAIMFSVFLLLATAKQVVNKDAVSTKIVNTPIETTEVKKGADLSETVLKGVFNIETPGNVVRGYDEEGKILYHYKAISSPRLKDSEINPTLKLETKTNGLNAWKEIQWSWIDYNQGTLYFHFKTVEGGIEKMADNYTGRYQLIFE